MARSRKAIEEEMHRHLKELWLLVQDWYEVQGVKVDTAVSKDIAQHYGSASFTRMTDGHWEGGFFNSASLSLRNPVPGKEPFDDYVDVGPRSDELYRALERHRNNGKNTEVNAYDGFKDDGLKDDGNRCPDD